MGSFKNILQIIVLIFLLGLGFSGCNNNQKIYLVIGERANKTEQLTTKQLKADIEKVSELPVQIITANEDIPSNGKILLLGTRSTNQIIEELAKNKSIIVSEVFPGSRGGIWATVKQDNQKVVVLAGSDVQGMQYAVYQYCKEILNVDPFEYWSGKTPNPKNDIFDVQNKIIAPPEIPILCYFENDVDELANLKTPLLEYDWESYTEMINSLVRLKYNAIHLFDMLGRPEFFQREPYQKMSPDYDVRLTFLDSLINYAHDMGMMVEIDLSLGYKIKPMSQDKADCWKNNKDEWIATWKYYFEETPIGKADILSLRPRNQVWDWEYKSSCGEDKTEVFNEVYKVLGDLIDNYNPNAIKVATCYADGMEIFNNDFSPPNDWIIAWSDDGWGGFSSLPERTKGYNFGTYMHAGFWKNHTVHDPYPEKIDTVMKMMVHRFQANKYWEINGQQFRPFLINIEAFSVLANSPEDFNGEAFYKEWSERYFGEKAAIYAVNSMKKLHEAQFDKVGYVENLSEINRAIKYLSNPLTERAEKSSDSFDYDRISSNYEIIVNRISIAKQALTAAEQGLEFVDAGDTFYNDYILLPVQLYLDLLTFENHLNEMAALKNRFEETGDKAKMEEALKLFYKAKSDLETVHKRSLEGDKNKKWAGWYDPVKRRPNNGFPTLEMLNMIETNLKLKL